jgi:pimeloyl-ACP methyl ester carboxylesterase
MTAEEITIPCGKHDWLWATHDCGATESKTLVLMIHGFPGDSRSYADVFDDVSTALVHDGFHTLRFDMRGCGQSDKGSKFFTLRGAYEDCTNVIQWAGRLGYKRFLLVTEGLGAVVALTVLTDAIRPKMDGAVLLWPILDPKTSGLMKVIANHPKFNENLIREINEYNFIPLLARITMPSLILRGTADDMAPASQVQALKTHNPASPVDILVFEKGGHGLKDAGDRTVMLTQIRRFFKKFS